MKTTLLIQNKLGLHARASAKLITCAAKYQSEITIYKTNKPNKTVNAKDIMDVMMLAAKKGDEITLTFDGEDEQEANEAMTRLINRKFDEEI